MVFILRVLGNNQGQKSQCLKRETLCQIMKVKANKQLRQVKHSFFIS